MKSFDELKEGQKVIFPTEGIMEVHFYDFYHTNEKIMCFFSDSWIYPAKEFDPLDVEVIEE